MSYPRREGSPPPGGLTPNERACLTVLDEEGANVSLTTTQVASRAKLGTSAATVALGRLVERGYAGRSDKLLRPPHEPVRWHRLASVA